MGCQTSQTESTGQHGVKEWGGGPLEDRQMFDS